MRVKGRRIVWWERAWLTRDYWRHIRAAMPAAQQVADAGGDLAAVHDALVAGWQITQAVEAAKAHSLEGCTPCREWLTALARTGQRDDVKAWLVENGLVAPGEFDPALWLTDQVDAINEARQ